MAEEKKLTRKEKRDKKFAEKPLSAFGSRFDTTYPYIWLLTYPGTAKTAHKFGWSVISNYAGIQFLHKWGLKKRQVINVDHPLDSKIPFTPAKVKTYMDFVPLFLRVITMYKQRYGLHKAAPLCNEWFKITKTLYDQAGCMYKHTLSTTSRPDYKDTLRFKLIHLFDPHLLCVPSLHIAIIAMATVVFKKQFKELGLSDAECFQKNTEIYNRAIEIAESVLYVKQHSVNCVPAALYMVTKLFPDLFTPNDATNFINDMFLTAETISAEDCAAIKEHISFTYERFLLEGYAADDWRDPVIRWIRNYNTESGENK